MADIDLLLESGQTILVGDVLYHNCCSAVRQNLLILDFKLAQQRGIDLILSRKVSFAVGFGAKIKRGGVSRQIVLPGSDLVLATLRE